MWIKILNFQEFMGTNLKMITKKKDLKECYKKENKIKLFGLIKATFIYTYMKMIKKI